jgi:NitT/TauT family transport system ATP-binding protein
VLVDGRPIERPRPDTISVVFQEYSLFPWRTVLGNVEAGLEFRGVPRGERRDRALRYLRMVGLDAFAGAVPRQLSGGMKQRVAIARALALETPLVLLDEPFGALDEQTRMVLGEEVSRIFAETEKTILLVTHSLAEAVFLSDRIAVMTGRPGRIREVVEVPAPHPRAPEFMTSKLFHELRDHLFRLLHDEMRASVLGSGAGAGPEGVP